MDSLRRRPHPKPIPIPSTPPIPTLSRPLSSYTQHSTPEPVFLSSTPPPQKIKKRPQRFRRLAWMSLGAFVGIFFLGALFLLYEGFTVSQNIRVEGTTLSAPTLTQKLQDLGSLLLPGKRTPLRGEERGRINVLLLGKAGAGSPGENLTDTLMLASINTQTHQVALFSLPRDLYYREPHGGYEGKINSFYQHGQSTGKGLQSLTGAVETITGQEIDYFFIIDFDGFEEVINAIGGVSVEVPKDFYDPRYPGKNFSYETFELKKGWQRLDGATALKYVRERHDDPEGDFGRAKRQQQVLEAVRDKALSPGTYLNFFRIHKLFQSVEKNVETNLSLKELQSFYQLSSEIQTNNITNVVLDAWKPESLLRVDHKMLGGTRAFILVPRIGTWEETKTLAETLFDRGAIDRRRQTLTEEQGSVLIIDKGETLQSAEKLSRYISRELGMKTEVLYLPEWNEEMSPGILFSRSALEKPVSFDELISRLPLTRKNTAGLTLPASAPRTDFIITMSPELATTFQNADEFLNENTLNSLETSPEL